MHKQLKWQKRRGGEKKFHFHPCKQIQDILLPVYKLKERGEKKERNAVTDTHMTFYLESSFSL